VESLCGIRGQEGMTVDAEREEWLVVLPLLHTGGITSRRHSVNCGAA
jgi:hypothetical protein